MANTFTSLPYHVIFSTKNREPWIRPELESRVWAYLGGIARDNDMKALRIGGIENHVHLLLGLPPTLALSKAVQLIKGGSSAWVKEAFGGTAGFGWQDGYAAFTVSKSLVPMWNSTSATNGSIIGVGRSSRSTVRCWTRMKSSTMNDISLRGSLWAEFKRRYATRSFSPLSRGLKPTATIIWSLRDRACLRRAGW